MPAAIAAIGGLLLGSFLHVVASRLPRGESLVAPLSCRAPIARRYPLIEALTAALFAAVVLADHAGRASWAGLALVALLVPVAVIDHEHRIIPNRLLAPAALTALALTAALEPQLLPERVIAAGAAGAFLLAAWLAYPAGMGLGDVKLAAVMGLFLGREVAVAMLVALVSGALLGVAIMARKGVREGRKTAVPFGVLLALGGVVALLVGPAIVHSYLHAYA